MSEKQNTTGDQNDATQADPRLPEPAVLTFCVPVPFDGLTSQTQVWLPRSTRA